MWRPSFRPSLHEVRISAEAEGGRLGWQLESVSLTSEWRFQLQSSGDAAVDSPGEMMWHLCAEVLISGAETGCRGQS